MIIGVVVFAVYLYFFVGFNEIFIVIKNLNVTGYLFLYALAIGIMLLVMLCWVASWITLLKGLSVNIGLKKAFLYYWVGDFVDMVIPCPAVCGDATRLYLVQKETKNSYGAIAAAGVTNRIIAYSIITAGLSAGTIYILTLETAPIFAINFLFIAWLGAIAWLSVLSYLALSENAAKKLATILVKVLKTLRIRKYSESLSPKVQESLNLFHDGFRFFRANPRYLVMPVIFQTLSFVLNLLVYVIVLSSLGFAHLSFDFFIVVYFLAGAIQDATASFSVGGLEILLTSIFIFYGLSPAVSGVAAAILRSVTFWFPLVVGYILLQVIGAKGLLKPKPAEENGAEQENKLFDDVPIPSAETQTK